jgi:hypothetical protein
MHSPSFVFRHSAPGRSEVSSPGQGLCLYRPPLLRLRTHGREWDLSGLQAILPVPLLRSTTPVESACPRHYRSRRYSPRYPNDEGFALVNFGANPQLQYPLQYASRATLPSTCKACFRLAGWPLPGGGRTLWIAAKGFSSFADHPPFLLS